MLRLNQHVTTNQHTCTCCAAGCLRASRFVCVGLYHDTSPLLGLYVASCGRLLRHRLISTLNYNTVDLNKENDIACNLCRYVISASNLLSKLLPMKLQSTKVQIL